MSLIKQNLRSARLLRLAEVADIVALARDTILALVQQRAFPAPVKPSDGISRWLDFEIQGYVHQLREQRDLPPGCELPPVKRVRPPGRKSNKKRRKRRTVDQPGVTVAELIAGVDPYEAPQKSKRPRGRPRKYPRPDDDGGTPTEK